MCVVHSLCYFSKTFFYDPLTRLQAFLIWVAIHGLNNGGDKDMHLLKVFIPSVTSSVITMFAFCNALQPYRARFNKSLTSHYTQLSALLKLLELFFSIPFVVGSVV